MPETEGARLLRLLLERYPRPTDADRAIGWPENRTAVYKSRGAIPAKEWDKVRAVVEPVRATDDGAHPLKDEPDLLRHLEQQTAILKMIPELRREVAILRAEVATLEAQLLMARGSERATRRRANRGTGA